MCMNQLILQKVKCALESLYSTHHIPLFFEQRIRVKVIGLYRPILVVVAVGVGGPRRVVSGRKML